MMETTGDFIGDFALLGDEDWGASVMLGVENIDVEVVAAHDHFVVCLELVDKPVCCTRGTYMRCMCKCVYCKD